MLTQEVSQEKIFNKKLRVVSDGGPAGTQVYLDDELLKNVASIEWSLGINDLAPTVKLELFFDDVELDYDPDLEAAARDNRRIGLIEMPAAEVEEETEAVGVDYQQSLPGGDVEVLVEHSDDDGSGRVTNIRLYAANVRISDVEKVHDHFQAIVRA